MKSRKIRGGLLDSSFGMQHTHCTCAKKCSREREEVTEREGIKWLIVHGKKMLNFGDNPLKAGKTLKKCIR